MCSIQKAFFASSSSVSCHESFSTDFSPGCHIAFAGLDADQGQNISLTGLLARVSLKQLKIEFYWLMLPAVIGIYMFTKTINLLV